jgi:hypothetical protein
MYERLGAIRGLQPLRGIHQGICLRWHSKRRTAPLAPVLARQARRCTPSDHDDDRACGTTVPLKDLFLDHSDSRADTKELPACLKGRRNCGRGRTSSSVVSMALIRGVLPAFGTREEMDQQLGCRQRLRRWSCLFSGLFWRRPVECKPAEPTLRPVDLAFSARLGLGRRQGLNRYFSDRQHHAKDSAARFVRRCPEPASMRFHDRATN